MLIKSGIFYEVYNNDISIIYSLFHYKTRKRDNDFNIGFPINNIGNSCNILDYNKINYIVIENKTMKLF